MQDLFGRAAGRALPEVRPLLRVHGLLQRAATTTAGAPQVPALQRAHRRRALRAQTQAALQTFMASRTRGMNRQQRRAAEQRKDKAQRVRKLSHAEEKKALQRGRRTPLADGATLLEYKGLYAVLEGGQRATPFVKPPPVLPAAAPPAPPRPPARGRPPPRTVVARGRRRAAAPARRRTTHRAVSHALRAPPRGRGRSPIKHGPNPGRRGGGASRTRASCISRTKRCGTRSRPGASTEAPSPAPSVGRARRSRRLVIVDHSGSMNAKDCLDDCGGKITRLEAAYDTLLNSYVKETRENAPDGKDIVVSLVTMSTTAEVIFERYRLDLAEDAISNHARVAYAHDHGNYLPALAEVERLFSQPIDAEGSHALGVVLLTDGKPSDTVTDPRFVSPALRGYDRIIAQLSWLLRDLEQKVDERFPRFACNLLGIGASRAEFKILDDVNADIKRGSVDHSALDSSLLSSTMTSMATTMMSSVLETSVCAGRAKRTVRKVAQESADAAPPRRRAARPRPRTRSTRRCRSSRRRSAGTSSRTTSRWIASRCCTARDLDDLLEGDDGAKSSFRMLPGPRGAEGAVRRGGGGDGAARSSASARRRRRARTPAPRPWARSWTSRTRTGSSASRSRVRRSGTANG